MVTLILTNSLTRAKAEVLPANPDGILRLYHCGPTVYGTPHLGNLRRFLVADLLVRAARFLGYRVRSVMNITDVGHLLDPDHAAGGQDRMLVAAQREGLSPEQIAAKYTAEFFAELTALRAEPADYYPRATMHLPQMRELIRRLLEKQLAYETSSGVYLDVTKFPQYGQLSGNTLEAIQAGSRVEVRAEKRHPADFALWIKAAPSHLMQWDSPWGRGYPGWHLECSAMAMQILGESIDIHSGGRDNLFPHHENEIAQSEGATGKSFVRIWVHNEFLEISEGKMSKSEGETVTLKQLTDRGVDPLAFRLLCLQTHYRSKLHFSWEALDGAAAAFGSLREFVRRLAEAADVSGRALDPSTQLGVNPSTQLGVALSMSKGESDQGRPHDPSTQLGVNPSTQLGVNPSTQLGVNPSTQLGVALNMSNGKSGDPEPAALAEIPPRLRALEQRFTEALADDLGSPEALAALFDFMREVNPRVQARSLSVDDAEAIRALFRKLDKVLAFLDVDAPLPSPVVPAAVQELVNQREEARKQQDFAAADRLRADIHTKGYLIEDTSSGPRLTPRSAPTEKIQQG